MSAIAPASTPLLAAPRRLLRLRSDAALAGRFAAGDEASFAILYERHRASVLAVCIGVLGSRHDAEDAAQEAFAALAQRGAPPENIPAWLTRVARNAAIDVARRRRDGGGVPPDDLPDLGRNQEARAELDSVMAGIKELPEAQRTALLMRELGGHSYREIGNLLELDEAAVRGLIARARIGLRAHREASETSCEAVRAALAVAPDDLAVHTPGVRRHVRGCPPCRNYRRGLQRDARALRGLIAPVAPIVGGGALIGRIAAKATKGGLVTKGALLGGAVNQITAACAVSVCAVGGFALLHPGVTRRQPAAPRHLHIKPIHHVPIATSPGPRSTSAPAFHARALQAAQVLHTGAQPVARATPRSIPAPVAGRAQPQHASTRSSSSAPARGVTPTTSTTTATAPPPAPTQNAGSSPAPSAPSPWAGAIDWALQVYKALQSTQTASPWLSWMTQAKDSGGAGWVPGTH